MSRITLRWGLGGLGFGLGLAVLTFGAMGAGHGTYLPFLLSSAPLGLTGVLTGLVGLPIWWMAIGALVGRARTTGVTWPALVLPAIHYAGIAWTLFHPSEESRHAAQVWQAAPWLLPTCLIWYTAGQILLCIGLWPRSQAGNIGKTIDTASFSAS